MVNYNQSIIYKLCCLDPNITEIYIGSTTNKYRRKQQHKSTCNNLNGKMYNIFVYQFIREHGGFSNWDMVIIEEFNATDKNDLHKQERHWIETLKSTLNKHIPTRTKNEYYEANKDVILEQRKDYIKEYREANKEETKDYNKDYYESNKDVISEQQKKYREANKEKINCICGGSYNKSILSHQKTHFNTQTHKNYICNVLIRMRS